MQQNDTCREFTPEALPPLPERIRRDERLQQQLLEGTQSRAKEAAQARGQIIKCIFEPHCRFDPVHGTQTPTVQPSGPITEELLQQYVFRPYAGLFPVSLVSFKELTSEEVSVSSLYPCTSVLALPLPMHIAKAWVCCVQAEDIRWALLGTRSDWGKYLLAVSW